MGRLFGMNGCGYRVKAIALISACFNTVYSETAQSQTLSDSHIRSTISSQDASSAANALLGNINILIAVSEGKLDANSIKTSASALISDTEAYLSVVSSYYKHQESIIQLGLNDLHLHLSSINAKIALAHKVGDVELASSFGEDAASAIAKIEAAKSQISTVRSEMSSISKNLKILSGVGTVLSLADLSQKGSLALKELKKSALSTESSIAQANFVFTSGVVALAAVGAKAAPHVALTQAGTDVGVWYADLLGDAVYSETNSRTEAIYSEIRQVGTRIQNRIKAAYLSGKVLTDEEASRIAREEYEKARAFVEGFRSDVGVIEWVFGVRGTGNKTIDDALFLIDTILDGRAEERAARYNQYLYSTVVSLNDFLSVANELRAEIGYSKIDLQLPNLPLPGIPNWKPPVDFPLKEGKADLTEEIQAEIIEKAKPTTGPDPRLIGIWSAVSIHTDANGHVDSYFYPQGMLTDVNRTVNPHTFVIDDLGQGGISSDTVGTADNKTNTTTDGSKTYSHLYWGTMNGSWDTIDEDTGLDHNMRKTHWLYGAYTPLSYVTARSGTAHYGGELYGDYASFSAKRVFYGTVTGDIALDVNFSTDRLTGNGQLHYGGGIGGTTESFSLVGQLDSYPVAANINQSLPFLMGDITGPNTETVGTGGFMGTFYGSEASEIGGSFWYPVRDGMLSGIFVAKEGAATSARMAASPTSLSIAAAPVADQASYSYASWGTWENDTPTGSTVLSAGGYWLAGEATPGGVVDAKTGSATYTGEMAGRYLDTNGQASASTGDISLTANFDTDRISGNMEMRAGDASTGVLNVDAGITGGNFSQDAGSFGVQGSFFGANAEEIGGTAWATTDGGSFDSVFRAKQ